MRKIKNISILLISAASVILGLTMPDIVLRMQDESNASRIELYEATQMKLKIAPSYGLVDVLEIIAKGFSLVDLEKGSRLSLEDVNRVTQEAFAHFDAQGFTELAPDNWTELEAVPFLAVSETGDEAIILWQCSAVNKADGVSEVHFLVDDAHSKIVEISTVSLVEESEVQDEKTQEEILSSWAQAWAEYLGFQYTYELISPEDKASKAKETKEAEDSSTSENSSAETSGGSSSKESSSAKEDASGSSGSGGGISGSSGSSGGISGNSLSNGNTLYDTAASVAKAYGFQIEDLKLQSEKLTIVALKNTNIELHLSRSIQSYEKEGSETEEEKSAVWHIYSMAPSMK